MSKPTNRDTPSQGISCQGSPKGKFREIRLAIGTTKIPGKDRVRDIQARDPVQAEIVARENRPPAAPNERMRRGVAKEKRETQKAEAKKRAEDEIGSKIDVAKAQLESANSQGDIARANEAVNTIQILEEQLDEWIERIEYRWNTRCAPVFFSDELYSRVRSCRFRG